jgi:hypothetical protein
MILAKYTNGNTKVVIYDDGTKIREFEGVAKPEFPESMDIKITNYCNTNCAWCHEMSNINGKHADLDKLLNILSPLPAGIELAIGGGNILTHPGLINFLQIVKQKGWIANATFNQNHLKNKLIKQLINDDLIKGIGISYSSEEYINDIKNIFNENVVFHLIMGINPLSDIIKLHKNFNKCKVLILGCKNWGYGKDYYLFNKEKIDNNKHIWYTRLIDLFSLPIVFSFDNLAIEQLNLKRYFIDEEWNKFYMGKEGAFSMYIDAVKQEFAISSTNGNRVSFLKNTLIDFFNQIK